MRIWKLVALGLGLNFAGMALANFDFAQADAAFFERNKGTDDKARFAKATEAHKLYSSAYQNSSLTEKEKTYAFIQMGRLDIFRGGMLPKISESERKEVLNGCIKYAQEELGKSGSQESHYFYLACMASLGKIASFPERMQLAYKLKKEVPEALKIIKSNPSTGFEAGGIRRVLAGIYANIKAKPVGFYKPEEAVSLSVEALNTSAAHYRPFPGDLTGMDFYDNYYYYAQALIAVGMNTNTHAKIDEALNILTEQIELIEALAASGTLPERREPESLYYKKLMIAAKKTLEKCKGDKWLDCLEDNLGKEEEALKHEEL